MALSEDGKEQVPGAQKKCFQYDPQALALLGIRTSVAVATVLAIPDAFALIPGSNTVTAWILALVGCWTAALVLWFVFFVGFLHVMRVLSGGIVIDGQGIKLWRFASPIAWSSICAVSIEDEPIFSKLFSYERCVKRLTLFVPLAESGGILGRFSALPSSQSGSGQSRGAKLILPQYIPSFLFSAEQFDEMCASIADRTYSLSCDSTPVLLVPASNLPALKKTHELARWQRIVVSLLVASGVSMFMARKAVVLYSYNEGLKAYREGDYHHAATSFSTATRFEPTFAPAWHGLAGSEFNLAEFAEARQHWQQALKWKPDYVEAKVSLAYMTLQQRDFQQAERLIKSALSLDPANPVALLNRADLNMRTGHVREAVQDARLVISLEPDKSNRETFMATCLLAHAKLLQGRPREASQLLAPLPITPERLRNGENLTYRLLIGAQTFLALNQVSKAEKLARLALQRGQSIDALLVMAEVRTACKDYAVAQSILNRCKASMPNNPWVYIHAAELDVAQKKINEARDELKAADNCNPPDPLSLSSIAHLYLAIGETSSAVQAAKMSLKLEPVNPVALQVIEQLTPTHGIN